jgi:hypothetical protein
MTPTRQPVPVEVPVGCLAEGPTWGLIQDLRSHHLDSRCPHVETLAGGQEVLPHALTAYTVSGYRSTTLCYDCVRAAVQTHFPAWDAPPEEEEMDTVTLRGTTYQLGGDPAQYPVPLPPWFPEALPGGWQEYPPPYGWDKAYNRVYTYRDTTRVLVSAAHYGDGKRWLHVSVSRKNRQLPSWETLTMVKDLFIGDERTALQVLPPRAKYVNIAPVLHLWHCLDGDVTPDFTAGGETI